MKLLSNKIKKMGLTPEMIYRIADINYTSKIMINEFKLAL